MLRRAIITAVTIAATGLLTASCSNDPASSAAAASITASTEAPASPTAALTAPASDVCSSFEQVYNAQVGPVMNGTGATGNYYLTQLTDAFNALAATVTGSDVYSQTIRSDALAVAEDPSSYTAMGTFATDLPQFLASCGMHESSPSAS
jgi:hypothetical protein